jgi:hypothetical protein
LCYLHLTTSSQVLFSPFSRQQRHPFPHWTSRWGCWSRMWLRRSWRKENGLVISFSKANFTREVESIIAGTLSGDFPNKLPSSHLDMISEFCSHILLSRTDRLFLRLSIVPKACCLPQDRIDSSNLSNFRLNSSSSSAAHSAWSRRRKALSCARRIESFSLSCSFTALLYEDCSSSYLRLRASMARSLSCNSNFRPRI